MTGFLSSSILNLSAGIPVSQHWWEWLEEDAAHQTQHYQFVCQNGGSKKQEARQRGSERFDEGVWEVTPKASSTECELCESSMWLAQLPSCPSLFRVHLA